MPRLRVPRSFAALRKAALTLLAGVLLSAGGDLFWARDSGEAPKAGFAIFAVAMAAEPEDAHPSPSSGGHKDSGKHSSSKPHGKSAGGDAQIGSGQHSVSYDAGRNMVKLHVKLGPAERRESGRPLSLLRREHESAAWFNAGVHSGDHDKRMLTDVYLRNIAEGWKPGHSLEALDKAVDPVATRYQSSVFAHPIATTIVTKTKLALSGLSFSPTEVLAVGVDPASIERAEALGFKANTQAATPEPSEHLVRFTVPPGLNAVSGRDILSRELPGHRFELNRIYRLYRAAMRNDAATNSQPAQPFGSAPQCAADRCFARQAIRWKESLAPCARGLRVGVIDTLIDVGHPAFAGREQHIHRDDFVSDGRSPAPDWHGTGVLALLAGSPMAGTPGLIPDAEFFAANVFFSDERGEMAADTISILKALDWMKSYDVKLINMSFSGPRDDLVGEAIERMSESGVLFVAAAGNEGPTADPSYPAAYPQVIAVTAVTKDLRNYRYANRGDHIDLAAPGVDIWTAVPGGREGYHTGTSFAAPHATAVLAVEPREILQQNKADLLDNLAFMDLGEQGRDQIYGRGLLLAPQSCTPPEDTIASADQ